MNNHLVLAQTKARLVSLNQQVSTTTDSLTLTAYQFEVGTLIGDLLDQLNPNPNYTQDEVLMSNVDKLYQLDAQTQGQSIITMIDKITHNVIALTNEDVLLAK